MKMVLPALNLHCRISEPPRPRRISEPQPVASPRARAVAERAASAQMPWLPGRPPASAQTGDEGRGCSKGRQGSRPENVAYVLLVVCEPANNGDEENKQVGDDASSPSADIVIT